MKWPLVGVLIGAVIIILLFSSRPLMLVNGQILTMDSDNSVVSSLGIRLGEIQVLGTPQHVRTGLLDTGGPLAWFYRILGVRELDLGGQTVIPGIIDAHSHFPSSGLLSQGVDLSRSPASGVSDMASLLSTISAQAQEQPAKRWIISFSYDDTALTEKRHPTRTELDAAAPDHAVYLRHRSGHMGVANSRALRALGYKPDVPQSDTSLMLEGGVGRDTQRLMSGLLQDRATPAMQRLLKEVPWWRKPAILLDARDEYLRAGVTTLQNGYADKVTLQMLRLLWLLGILPQRIVVWPAHDKLTDSSEDSSLTSSEDELASPTSPATTEIRKLKQWPKLNSETLHVGAIKLIADGSPQGRTAWLSEPYLPDELLKPGSTGIAYQLEPPLQELIVAYHQAGYQLAIHGNGDAAIQQIIEGLRFAQREHPREDARHILVHAQTITKTQLQALAELNITASFFPTHTHYWGDWYRQRALGEPRASNISPLASADEAGVRYSMHTDSPVTPIDSIHLIYTATERVTSSGFLLGAEQRISRLRALRAITIDAAWQNHLDGDRGSLEPGKLADFVILSDDPLLADEIRRIQVRQVWIGGNQHFP